MKTRRNNGNQKRKQFQGNGFANSTDALGDHRSSDWTDPADEFGSLVLLIKDSAERLDPRVAEFNDRMTRLHELGLFNKMMFLGPIVLQRGYGIFGDTSSGRIVQAGLCTCIKRT